MLRNGVISQCAYNGTVYVTYDVTDGIANTAASINFDLAAVNDAPDLTGTKAVLGGATGDNAGPATEDTVYH